MRIAQLLLPLIISVPSIALAQPASGPPGAPTLSMVQRRAPMPPPVLMVERDNRSHPLQLTKVDIAATIVGHLARTEMTMTFYNPNNRVMAGDLYFPLPQGSTVSGYALDIQGVLVEGVVVEKDKARQVFEKEVRKGVDPGLVEWTKGQNFKTRVFPIPAKGSRTIRVSYVSEVLALREGAMYHLPLSFRDTVKQLSLRVDAVKAAAMPVVVAGGPAGLQFAPWQGSFVAKASLTNAKLAKDLYVRLPELAKHPVRVERAADGRTYFSIRDAVATPTGARPAPQPRRIAVYWDASLSREALDHTKELALLDAYLNRLGTAAVDVYLVVFRDVAEAPRRFVLPRQRASLMAALRGVTYDGGTQLASAQPPRRMPAVDLSLLFSDGISNYGSELPRALRAPVYAVNVATSASHAALRFIALRSGGAYLNLTNTTVAAASQAIGSAAYSFISAKVSGTDAGTLYPQLPVPVNGAFDLVGQLTGKDATVTLQYGYAGTVTHTRTHVVKASDGAQGDLLRRYWAQKKLDDLIVFAKRNQDAITALGRDYAIVTPGTSLMVLESLSQYLEHEIRPPAGLPKMRAAYDGKMRERVLEKKKEDASKLTRLLGLWATRVKWWNTRFKIPKPKPKPKRGGKWGTIGTGRYGTVGHGSGYGSGAGRGGMAGRRARAPRVMIGRASVAGSRTRGPAPEKPKPEAVPAPPPQPSIELKPWDPKTPYLAAIKAAPSSGQYAVYLAQRKSYRTSPAFYLDCASHFHKAGQSRLALRVLSNLAELELENPQLLRVLAYRLAELGQLDLSVQIFDDVLELRPEEPQSYRDLALVLDRRAQRKGRGRKATAGDYRRALFLLSKVVMNKWDRFDEIEVIALTELNAILPRARRYGVKGSPVDKRLIKKLHMDVRIVMSWDADNTDMDLHVVDPTGEEASYENNKTKIGGIVTRDFTDGYGPEVYAIRRAMRGKYKIQTKFYGSSAAKLIGAVTLKVDIYTNFGRANEKRKSLTLRLTKEKETFTVGTIAF